MTAKDKIVIDGETYVKEDAKSTHVHFILDNSGSMASVLDATISGFNEYIQNLQRDSNKYTMSLVKFGSVPETVFTDKDINDVDKLNEDTYSADGGMTALYDAVCSTLNKIENPKDGKHLVVIMTDGGENASVEYNMKQFIALKKKFEKGDNFTFVFLGANQDAWSTAVQFGFSQGNVASYKSTSKGTDKVFDNLTRSTQVFASSAMSTTDSYFSKDQQEDLKNE